MLYVRAGQVAKADEERAVAYVAGTGGTCRCGAPLCRRTKSRPTTMCRACWLASRRKVRLCACGCGSPTSRAQPGGRYLSYATPECRHGHVTALLMAGDYVVGGSGCWVWQRKRTKHGYGAMTRGGEVHAHRWYYRRFVGPIPDGHEVHHVCENRLCVNPAHLEALTRLEHVGRHVAA